MIQVYLRNSRQSDTSTHPRFPLELGRSASGEDQNRSVPRIVVDDEYVSRHHVRLEQPDPTSFLLKNVSTTRPVKLSDGSTIPPGESRTLKQLVISFTIGNTKVDVETIEEQRFATIAAPAMKAESDTAHFMNHVESMPTVEMLTEWFETLISVQRAAAGSPDFYDRAAQAIINLIGFDEGLVLLRDGDDWHIAGQGKNVDPDSASFSRSILRKVTAERRTFYQSDQSSQSLVDVSAVACSPVFEASGESVKGVVYGSRSQQTGAARITPLEAQLLQTLAGVVSIGMARMTSETKAARLSEQFDRFFSPKLARELERDPTLLEGRERKITTLFADIRGFSRISEKLPPEHTCEMVIDVMQCLSNVVLKNDGSIVDYTGDGMMAIWNAPTDQPDHAQLACRTALEAQIELPSVSRKWERRIGSPVQMGIGINTGNALVGNTGTHSQLKYGALGHAVNVASRVEGATKQLAVPILVTRETQQLLGDSFLTRRLLQVRLMGIQEAVELYELHADDPAGQWSIDRQIYEKALQLFEDSQWSAACQCIQPLLFAKEDKIDLPSLILAGRSIDCLKCPPTAFDPVMSMDRK